MAKPTRRQLLAYLAEIQNAIGDAGCYSLDDTNPNRGAALANALRRAHKLCVEAQTHDRPVTIRERLAYGFKLTTMGEKVGSDG